MTQLLYFSLTGVFLLISVMEFSDFILWRHPLRLVKSLVALIIAGLMFLSGVAYD